MALMSLAHIFTGVGPDFGNIRRSLAKEAARTKLGKEDAKRESADDAAHGPELASNVASSRSACVQQRRLREAEDDRWLQVECGSPKRWRSCKDCAFLSAAKSPVCEVCGMAAPGRSDADTSDDSQAAAEASTLRKSPSHANKEESRRRSSLEEVVVADDGSVPDDIREVARHNLIVAIFRALDRTRRERLGPEDLQRFSQLAGFPDSDNQSKWSQDYVDLSKEYGWQAMSGANLAHFLNCVDDVSGRWHCPIELLRTLLTRLDKQDSLSGSASHTAAALRLGSSALELTLPGCDGPRSGGSSPSSAGERRRKQRSYSRDLLQDQMAAADDVKETVEEEKGAQDSASEDDDEDGEDEDSDCDDQFVIPGTLDEVVDVGTEVQVLYNNDVWYPARVVQILSTCEVEVEYEDGEIENLDVQVHAIRLIDFVSDDEDDEEDEGDEEEDSKQRETSDPEDEEDEEEVKDEAAPITATNANPNRQETPPARRATFQNTRKPTNLPPQLCFSFGI